MVLSVSQSLIINIGLALNLLLANWQIVQGELVVGDFVLINTYMLQLYAPLYFLGTFWRMIRQAMVDVEQIFNSNPPNKEIQAPQHYSKLFRRYIIMIRPSQHQFSRRT